MAKRKTIAELEEEFYEDFERPEVLPYITGFAGLDPCGKGGGGEPGLTTNIVVDGGEI